MITIENTNIWAKVIADAVKAIDANIALQSWEKLRYLNAVAKAAHRVDTSGHFMDYSADDDRLLIWSDSNEIYTVERDGKCQCLAFMKGYMCWHRAAKRLMENYNQLMLNALCSAYVSGKALVNREAKTSTVAKLEAHEIACLKQPVEICGGIRI